MPLPLLALGGLAAGAAGSIFSGLSSKKAKIPDFVPPDLEAVSQQTAQSNIKALPSVQEAESKMNVFRTEELTRMLESVSPGLSNLASKATQALTSMVSGQLTPGEEQMLSQKSAAWGAGAGLSGSGMAINERLFGYSNAMQQRIQQGLSSSMQWIQTARSAMTPGMADYSGMFMTPVAQARNEAMQIASAKYGGNVAQAQANAAPNPLMQSAGGFLSNVGGVAAGAGFQSWQNDKMWQNIAKMYESGSVSTGGPSIQSGGATVYPVGGRTSMW